VRVLQSFPSESATTNPYVLQLSQELGRDHTVIGFSWPRALLGRYDVFHAHWPEALLHGSTPGRSLAKRLLFRALLSRLKLQRIAVVRTVHNVRSHEQAPANEERLLDRFDRRTDLCIRLNDTTVVLPGVLVRTISHGHYRDWYARIPPAERVAGRVLFFGLIRPYKGVDTLITAFSELVAAENSPALSLHIVGRPYTEEIGDALERRVGGVDGIRLRLGHASEEVLATEIFESTLVALPYREMHNSGAVLLALSLGRPVLVPSNVVTEDLREEVGDDWIQTYPGDFSADVLAGALARAQGIVHGALPDLSRRDWPAIGRAHGEAYLAAVSARRSRRGALKSITPSRSRARHRLPDDHRPGEGPQARIPESAPSASH
jgi:beta-1,4-mannosyltransferase